MNADVVKIELGSLAKDTVTGFEGIVVAQLTWLNGCVRFGLQPQKLHEGKPVEMQYFDSQQILVLVRKSWQVEDQDARGLSPKTILAATGGDRPAPTRNADPRR